MYIYYLRLFVDKHIITMYLFTLHLPNFTPASAPRTSCRLPDDVPCSVDFSQCLNVFAGESCEVSCGPSFTGNVTEASCQEGNTDPMTPLEWTFPGCILSCQVGSGVTFSKGG